MPVQTGKTGTRCWMRWGKTGKKYLYKYGNIEARLRARYKAMNQGQAIHTEKLMLDQTWLRSKYCFHPPKTAIAMLWKDDYRQQSRKQQRLTNKVLVLTEVPEPIMMLMRQRRKQCGNLSTSHPQR